MHYNREQHHIGKSKKFQKPGKPSSADYVIQPGKGFAGEKVIIHGENFSSFEDNVEVKFDGVNALIDSLDDETIYVTSPFINETKNVAIIVTVSGMESTSRDSFSVLYAWERKQDYPGPGIHSSEFLSIGGKGYLIGGREYNSDYQSTGPITNKIWEYDPLNDTWVTKQNTTPPNLTYILNNAFTLEGTSYLCSEYFLSKYDPESGISIEVTGLLGRGLRKVFVIDHDVYYGFSKDDYFAGEIYKYNILTKEWTKLSPFGGENRYDVLGFSLNGKGYIVFGSIMTGISSQVWEYDPATDHWTKKNNFPGYARTKGICFKLKTKMYIGLGTNGGYSVNLSTIWEYEQESDTWVKKDPFPGGSRSNAIVFTLNDKAYIGTGLRNHDNFKDLWEFNPNK